MRVLKRLFAVAAVIALLLVGVYFIFHIDNVTVEGTEYYSDIATFYSHYGAIQFRRNCQAMK